MREGRLGTLAGGKAIRIFLGDYGDDRLVLIDPSSDIPFRVVDLNVRDVHFVLDPERVKLARVFSKDGKLHALDVLSGELVRSTQVTEPYIKEGHWRDPRPRLAVMGDMIAITDPREELVRLLDVESFDEMRTIGVEGLPFDIVAFAANPCRNVAWHGRQPRDRNSHRPLRIGRAGGCGECHPLGVTAPYRWS